VVAAVAQTGVTARVPTEGLQARAATGTAEPHATGATGLEARAGGDMEGEMPDAPTGEIESGAKSGMTGGEKGTEKNGEKDAGKDAENGDAVDSDALPGGAGAGRGTGSGTETRTGTRTGTGTGAGTGITGRAVPTAPTAATAVESGEVAGVAAGAHAGRVGETVTAGAGEPETGVTAEIIGAETREPTPTEPGDAKLSGGESGDAGPGGTERRDASGGAAPTDADLHDAALRHAEPSAAEPSAAVPGAAEPRGDKAADLAAAAQDARHLSPGYGPYPYGGAPYPPPRYGSPAHGGVHHGPPPPGYGPPPQGGARNAPPPAYVPPPLFPRPQLPDAPRWLLLAAGAVGLVAALALPYAATGLGLVITAVALGAGVFPALIATGRRRITPWTVAFGIMAYALVSVALFRDADWLVWPLLSAAFCIAALGISGAGAGWLSALRGGLSVVLAVFPLPWFLEAPAKRLVKHRRVVPLLVSIGITLVLLLVFGVLFVSADAVFSAFASQVLQAPDWASSLPVRIFLFFVFAVGAAAAVLVALRPVAEPTGPDLRISVSRAVWVIPLVGLDLLFASFVAVQLTVLFGGNRRVLSTAGLTYAEYARSGFFELVTVSVFVLGIVVVAVGLFGPKGRKDQRLLAVLLGLLCAFTLVILASALHRLGLYTGAYGWTRLRASVGATIWWLAAVFVLVLIAGAVWLSNRGTAWLPRTLVMVTGICLLAFAVWNPDVRVAETQLTVRGVYRLDHDYLGDLGAEAVPTLDRLPEPIRSCVLRDVVAANDLTGPDPWNGWNLAREKARDVLGKRPLANVSCAEGVPRTVD